MVRTAGSGTGGGTVGLGALAVDDVGVFLGTSPPTDRVEGEGGAQSPPRKKPCVARCRTRLLGPRRLKVRSSAAAPVKTVGASLHRTDPTTLPLPELRCPTTATIRMPWFETQDRRPSATKRSPAVRSDGGQVAAGEGCRIIEGRIADGEHAAASRHRTDSRNEIPFAHR